VRSGRRATSLQAAKAVLLERGVEAVTMDDVAQRAGTTKRTVYAHVHNKQAMVSAVVEESTRRFLAQLPHPGELHDDAGEAVVRYAARVEALLTWQDPIRLQRLVLGELWRSPDHGLLLLRVFALAEERLAAFLAAAGVSEATRCAGTLLAALVSQQHLRSLFGAGDLPPALEASAEDASDHAWRVEMVRAVTRLPATPT
jgi:AcrR family transcriptional regulator